MKVLFLDVDGVLNCESTTERMPDGFMFVEDRLVERLRDIVKATGVEIVLSSDWRLVDRAYELLASKLDEFGIRLRDVTPNLRWDIRGAECNGWAMKHKVEKWVAIDDRPELFGNPDWVIPINPKVGLTDVDARTIVEFFNKEDM